MLAERTQIDSPLSQVSSGALVPANSLRQIETLGDCGGCIRGISRIEPQIYYNPRR